LRHTFESFFLIADNCDHPRHAQPKKEEYFLFSTGHVATTTNVSMTKTKDAGLSPALVETVAGLSAGSMATLIVHPLDIVKTRMQSIYPTLLFPR
jgi:hypothetical protein